MKNSICIVRMSLCVLPISQLKGQTYRHEICRQVKWKHILVIFVGLSYGQKSRGQRFNNFSLTSFTRFAAIGVSFVFSTSWYDGTPSTFSSLNIKRIIRRTQRHWNIRDQSEFMISWEAFWGGNIFSQWKESRATLACLYGISGRFYMLQLIFVDSV